MELQFIQVNQPGHVQDQHLQESDMRRHAARVAHRRMKDKTFNSPKTLWPVNPKSSKPAKRQAVASTEATPEKSKAEREDNDEIPSEALVSQNLPKVIEIDVIGKAVPKWLPFWQETISKGSKEFCEIFNCVDTVAPDTAPQWILHESVVHFHASSMLLFYQILLDPTAPPPKMMFEYRVKAFAALRKELETNGPTDFALLSVCGLTTMEKKFGTDESFRLHYNMLIHLINQRDGLGNIHPHVRASILQYTTVWSADLQILDQKSIPCGPAMHYPVVSLSLLQHLPLGFQRLVEGGHISTDVLNVLLRITDKHLQHRHPKDANDGTRGKSLISFSPHGQALHPDPISACPIMSMPDEGDFIFQKALCQTLFHYVAWHIAPFSPLVRHSLGYRNNLTEQLPKIAESENQAQERCLFWMWQTVIDTWRMPKYGMSPQGQKLEEEQSQRFSKFYAGQETETILREFSWDFVGD